MLGSKENTKKKDFIIFTYIKNMKKYIIKK